MLNRHPQVAICDETFYFYWVYQRRRAFGDLRDDSRRRLLVERWMATNRIRRLELDAAPLREALLRDGISYPALFEALIREYARQRGRPVCGEKTPDHALVAETLCDWYPTCRLIHIARDPRDVAASLGRMPWGGGHTLINARRWVDCVAAAECLAARPNFIRLRYENLVAHPEGELRRLCTALDLDFDASMLIAEKPKQVDQWWFERAQGGVTTDRVSAYRVQLSPRDVALIEWVSGEWMSRLGYPRSSQPPNALIRIAARMAETVSSVRGKFANLPTMYHYWLRPTQLAAEERARAVP